jgi:hypothetical protein
MPQPRVQPAAAAPQPSGSATFPPQVTPPVATIVPPPRGRAVPRTPAAVPACPPVPSPQPPPVPGMPYAPIIALPPKLPHYVMPGSQNLDPPYSWNTPWWPYPRPPRAFESETRAAGTGLIWGPPGGTTPPLALPPPCPPVP